MDKYEELKLLFSKIDEYFDDAKDDYEERYRAWLKIIFNNESDRAKSEMPKVGVLKQLVIDWLNEHNKILPLIVSPRTSVVFGSNNGFYH